MNKKRVTVEELISIIETSKGHIVIENSEIIGKNEIRAIRNFNFYNIRFENCDFCNIRFEKCDFNLVHFQDCSFNLSFYESTIKKCYFKETIKKDTVYNIIYIDKSAVLNTIFYDIDKLRMLFCSGSDNVIINCHNYESSHSEIFLSEILNINSISFNHVKIDRSIFNDIGRLYLNNVTSYCSTYKNINMLSACSFLFKGNNNNNILDETKTILSLENSNLLPLCPEEGPFIGYKKICTKNGGYGIAKLLILENSKRSSGYGRKCRCDRAKVLSIHDINENEKAYSIGFSIHKPNFLYKVGEVVKADSFDENRWEECSNGIHFFMTKKEAIAY